MIMLEYIKNIISELNKYFGVCLTPRISDNTNFRYPMYCNCVVNTIYVWEEFFSALTEEQKKLHIVYVYSALMAAKLYGKERIIDGHKSIELPFNPNKIAMIICERINVKFTSFEELQREVYETRQRLFRILILNLLITGSVMKLEKEQDTSKSLTLTKKMVKLL